MNVATRVGVLGLVVVVGVFAAATASGADYFVNAEGSGDFLTIQAAVDSVSDGDNIFLSDGTYTGDGNRDIVVPSKEIAIAALSGDPTACVIDCEGSDRAEHRAFHFTATGGPGDPQLYGIGIRNGYMESSGGGMWVEGASPVISYCVVQDCVADENFAKGGGLYVSDQGSPSVIGSTFTGNSAGWRRDRRGWLRGPVPHLHDHRQQR